MFGLDELYQWLLEQSEEDQEKLKNKCVKLISEYHTRSDLLSSADVASSSRSNRGFRTRARAMAILCFCPPLKCVFSLPPQRVW
jgi:hypothetical protein